MNQQIIALATGLVTIFGVWLQGNHRWEGWLVGLLNQGLWFVFIVVFGAWGLLPLCAVFGAVDLRNLLKWRREASA